jgi:hypothetical protein
LSLELREWRIAVAAGDKAGAGEAGAAAAAAVVDAGA